MLKPGDIVIYESTVYPGCTEEECVPVLESEGGLTFNRQFYCGYSPERMNPGDREHTVETITKVTSGSTPEVAEFVDELYRQVVRAGTHRAASIRVAEAAGTKWNFLPFRPGLVGGHCIGVDPYYPGCMREQRTK